MVNPKQITNFNSTNAQLEEVLLFWVLAAGKGGDQAARVLDRLIDPGRPFNSLEKYSRTQLQLRLLGAGMGCHTAKARTIHELIRAGLNLKTCSLVELDAIYGIGPKTASCFILHSRAGAQSAGLDTHVLKYLKSVWVVVPKSTPEGKKYEELEAVFLWICAELQVTPAQFDLQIWTAYNSKNQAVIESLPRVEIEKIQNAWPKACGRASEPVLSH